MTAMSTQSKPPQAKQPTAADRHIELTARLDRIEKQLARLVSLLDKQGHEAAGREAGEINRGVRWRDFEAAG